MSNSVYSPSHHLAQSIFPSEKIDNLYFGMMTAHTAYFDASGDRNQGHYLVVGGYAASVKAWKAFDIHWGKILEKAGVDQFHMTDFLSNEKPFDGDKWKKTDGYSDNFLKKLVNAICAKAEFSIASLVHLDAWRELNKEYRMKESGLAPLALAGSQCVALTYKWGLDRGIPMNHMQMIFEGGDLDRGQLLSIVRQEIGIVLPPFQSKQINALQACDLIAWEAANVEKEAFKSKISGSKFVMRQSMREILKRIPCEPLQNEYDGMLHMCKERNVPKR